MNYLFYPVIEQHEVFLLSKKGRYAKEAAMF